LDEILTEACRLAGEALGIDLAKVVELQEDGKTLLVRAGVGWKPGVIGVATITAEDDTSEGHALRTGEPRISPDIATETRFKYSEFLIDNDVRAVANVGVVQDRPFLGYRGARKPPAREDRISVRRVVLCGRRPASPGQTCRD
jgi:GAF domain-containing protein